MQVEKNSVWNVLHIDGIEDGMYRVLAHYPDDNSLILFKLRSDKGLERPVKTNYSNFLKAMKCGDVTIAKFSLPFYQVVAQEKISSAYRKIRDDRFELILPRL